MKFIVKFFPEITIKSPPVRRRFVKQLRDNLRRQIKRLPYPEGANIDVIREWDKITIDLNDAALPNRDAVIEILATSPGIAYFLQVVERPLGDLDDIKDQAVAEFSERLAGKTFVVRAKRSGQHDYTSHDLEVQVGGALLHRTDAVGVKLKGAEETILLEVRDDVLFLVNARFKGIGGFPLGSLDPVVSLISGGFDSTVSSYLTMRRGMRTHFCFFNLGGKAHEVAVKEVALYLWMKYGSSTRVQFITVPFESVVAEILTQVNDSQMGVVLKRMMLRAGERVAERLEVDAIVTGESIAQVSSQTLANLNVIDSVSNKLVIRPLITSDKNDIIQLAREIGTEDFAANIPEYCGVISVKPTTRAKQDRIEAQENNFDFAILDQAIEAARFVNIDELANEDHTEAEVEEFPFPLEASVVIDVRHPNEVEHKALRKFEGGSRYETIAIPFYELHTAFAELSRDKTYMLYCDQGVMSRLHAAHLLEEGYQNVAVLRP